MARPNGNDVPSQLYSDAAELVRRAYLEGYHTGENAALAKIKSLFGGPVGVAVGTMQKVPTRGFVKVKPVAAKTPAVRRKRRNPWANLTPEERQVRVNAIRKGKGLPLVPLASAAEPKKRGPTVRDNSPPVIPIEQATTPVDDSETFHKGV